MVVLFAMSPFAVLSILLKTQQNPAFAAISSSSYILNTLTSELYRQLHVESSNHQYGF